MSDIIRKKTVLDLIDANRGDLESLTTNKVDVADIADNLTTSDATKVLSANQGVIIDGRLDTLEAAIGESGSVADDIAVAKNEAIAQANTDSSNKDAVVLAEAQRHINEEIGKVETRLDALEGKVGEGYEEITSAEIQALFAQA